MQIIGDCGAVFTQVKSLDPPYPDVAELIAQLGEKLPAKAINGADWILSDSTSANRLRRMEKVGPPLKEYAGCEIYSGIKTGYNGAFWIDGETRTSLIQADRKSAAIIKPLVRGDDIRKWQLRENDLFII